jgi:hypothetical protein
MKMVNNQESESNNQDEPLKKETEDISPLLQELIRDDFKSVVPATEKTEKLLSEGKTLVYRYITLEELAFLFEKGEVSAEILGKPLNRDKIDVEGDVEGPVLFGYAPRCWLTPQHHMIRLEIDVTDTGVGSGKASYTYTDRYADDIPPTINEFPEVYFKSYSLIDVVSIGFDDDPYPEADWYLDELIRVSNLKFFIPHSEEYDYPPGPKREEAKKQFEEERLSVLLRYASMSYSEFTDLFDTEVDMHGVEALRASSDRILTNNPDNYRLAMYALLKIYSRSN